MAHPLILSIHSLKLFLGSNLGLDFNTNLKYLATILLALRGQRHIPSKTEPKYPPPPPLQTKHDSFARNSPISTVLNVECFLIRGYSFDLLFQNGEISV